MATLIYIHGFLSSPFSAKAQLTQQWLAHHRPDIHFICPQLTPYPDECFQALDQAIIQVAKPVYLMGSSMGGFWATYFSERYNAKAVLINPAVNVLQLLPAYLNQPLKNYHQDDEYFLTEEHLAALAEYIVPELSQPENYWLLAQKGDEVLDYQLAEKKYAHCQQTLEEGGDHSFQGFDRYIEKALLFFESKR